MCIRGYRRCAVVIMMSAVVIVGCDGGEFQTSVSAADAGGPEAAAEGGGATGGAGGSQDDAGGPEAAAEGGGATGGAGGGQDDAGGPEAAAEGGTDASEEPVTCPPTQHVCGGWCVDNTPEQGCAVQCSPCGAPQHGIPKCAATGECDWTCALGCTKVGSGCSCPAPSCCIHSDCAGGNACYFGVCTTWDYYQCNDVLCSRWCMSCQGADYGQCNGTKSCVCRTL